MEEFKQNELSWNDFEKVAIHVGTILEVNDFPEARKPAYQLTIDFGATIGIKKNVSTNHKAIRKSGFNQSTNCGCCQFSQKANRQIHERMSCSWCGWY